MDVITWTLAALVAVLTAYLVYSFVCKTFMMPRNSPAAPVVSSGSLGTNEIITVYVFPAAGATTSSSPFATKLLTYCRLTGIPHVVEVADPAKAPNGKIPFISHGANLLGDSQLIIRYLENTFDVPKSSHQVVKNSIYGDLLLIPYVCFNELNPGDKSICNMVRLVCEGELYWGLVSLRFLGNIGVGKSESLWHNTIDEFFHTIPSLIRPLVTAMIRVSTYHDAYAQGLARHAPEDQLVFIKNDLKSLSTVLGNKRFFLGDFPSECDCFVYGLLGKPLWTIYITQLTVPSVY